MESQLLGTFGHKDYIFLHQKPTQHTRPLCHSCPIRNHRLGEFIGKNTCHVLLLFLFYRKLNCQKNQFIGESTCMLFLFFR